MLPLYCELDYMQINVPDWWSEKSRDTEIDAKIPEIQNVFIFNKQHGLNVYVRFSLKTCGAIHFLTYLWLFLTYLHGCSAGEQLPHTGALTVTIRAEMAWCTKTVIRLLVATRWQLHTAHWHTWWNFVSWSCGSQTCCQTALWLIGV